MKALRGSTGHEAEAGKLRIARQPIVNRAGKVVAYELLFRSGASQAATVGDASQATASVIVNALSGFGLGNILGKRKGFLNFDLDLLVDDALNLLPKEQVVLELLETLRVTPELVQRCRSLKKDGFTLALDDHIYDPAYSDLYQVADIVKVDLVQSPVDRLREEVEHYRPYPLHLLAEKVETPDQYRVCLDLGFDLFQGFYFARPTVLEMKHSDNERVPLLDLMHLLEEEAELSEIEKVFSGNAGLTESLLMLVTSAGVCAVNGVDRVCNAITLLGRPQVKRWVHLALTAAMA